MLYALEALLQSILEVLSGAMLHPHLVIVEALVVAAAAVSEATHGQCNHCREWDLEGESVAGPAQLLTVSACYFR